MNNPQSDVVLHNRCCLPSVTLYETRSQTANGPHSLPARSFVNVREPPSHLRPPILISWLPGFTVKLLQGLAHIPPRVPNFQNVSHRFPASQWKDDAYVDLWLPNSQAGLVLCLTRLVRGVGLGLSLTEPIITEQCGLTDHCGVD